MVEQGFRDCPLSEVLTISYPLHAIPSDFERFQPGGSSPAGICSVTQTEKLLMYLEVDRPIVLGAAEDEDKLSSRQSVASVLRFR